MKALLVALLVVPTLCFGQPKVLPPVLQKTQIEMWESLPVNLEYSGVIPGTTTRTMDLYLVSHLGSVSYITSETLRNQDRPKRVQLWLSHDCSDEPGGWKIRAIDREERRPQDSSAFSFIHRPPKLFFPVILSTTNSNGEVAESQVIIARTNAATTEVTNLVPADPIFFNLVVSNSGCDSPAGTLLFFQVVGPSPTNISQMPTNSTPLTNLSYRLPVIRFNRPIPWWTNFPAGTLQTGYYRAKFFFNVPTHGTAEKPFSVGLPWPSQTPTTPPTNSPATRPIPPSGLRILYVN